LPPPTWRSSDLFKLTENVPAPYGLGPFVQIALTVRYALQVPGEEDPKRDMAIDSSSRKRAHQPRWTGQNRPLVDTSNRPFPVS
jgi:hypothetical protein